MQPFIAVLSVSFLALLPTLIDADCGVFIPNGVPYMYTDWSQMQIASSGATCPADATVYNATTNGTTPLRGRNATCFSSSGTTNATYYYWGCEITASGYFSAHGFTNLSVSATDAAPLYTLVNMSEPASVRFNTTINDQAFAAGFFPSYAGCMSEGFVAGCIPPASSGYFTIAPALKCVNGTLQNCTNGPVDSGTPMQICGVATIPDVANQGSLTSPQTIFPDFGWEFVNTTATGANVTSNPLYNDTCYKLYNTSSGAARDITGYRLMLSVTVAVAVVVSLF